MSPVVAPGFTAAMPRIMAFIGDVDEAARLQLDVADEIHAAGVAVPAVDDHGDVDIDDVAVAQRLVAGMPWQTTWLIEVHSVWR